MTRWLTLPLYEYTPSFGKGRGKGMDDIYLFIIDGSDGSAATYANDIRMEIKARTEKQALRIAKKVARREKYKVKFALQLPEKTNILEEIKDTVNEIADKC